MNLFVGMVKKIPPKWPKMDGWMEGWMDVWVKVLNFATNRKAQARQIHVMWAPRAKRFDDQASSPEMVSRDPQKWSSFKLSILELSILVITIFDGKTHYKWPFSIAMLVYQRVSVVGVLPKRHPESRVIVASKPFNNTGKQRAGDSSRALDPKMRCHIRQQTTTKHNMVVTTKCQ